MRYIANVALSVNGDRIEKGAEIELTKDQASVIDPADITPLDGAADADQDAGKVIEQKAIEDMNVDELKAKAKELGLPVGGTKADLIERIKLHGGAADADQDAGK